MKTELSVFQSQALSPIQIQSLNVLSMNIYELTDYLNEIQLENPFLDYEPLSYSSFQCKKNIENNYTNHAQYNYNTNQYPSLREYLISQFDLYGISKQEYKLLDILICNLNENGYLEINADELSALVKYDKALVLDAIAYLQSLEPAGIGAYDLKECLKIQLRKLGCQDMTIYKIIDNNLSEIANNKFKKIAAAHEIPLEKAIEYSELIKSLNPKPASPFGNETSRFIDPDVFVSVIDNTIAYELNMVSFPHCTINRCYAKFEDNADNETKEYIKSKLTQAQYVVKSIQNRIKTFEKIVNLIIQVQSAFFLNGGDLVPLTLEEAAEILSIHKSTMSRAIRGKYLECSFGLFPLKAFFEITYFSDQTPSAIKNLIAKLIQKEDKHNPLSDENISKFLKDKGINISRRTIASYRSKLGIPNSNLRKICKL